MKKKILASLSILMLLLGSANAFADGPGDNGGPSAPPECPAWLCGSPDDDDDPVKGDKNK